MNLKQIFHFCARIIYTYFLLRPASPLAEATEQAPARVLSTKAGTLDRIGVNNVQHIEVVEVERRISEELFTSEERRFAFSFDL
jgi:hypothetical protein